MTDFAQEIRYTCFMMYIDVYACWNLFMDTALLALTGRLRGEKCRWFRLLLGGSLGMLWAILAAVLPLLYHPGFLGAALRGAGNVLASLGMCAAAFGVGTAGRYFSLWRLLFLLTWIVGGIMRWLWEWSSLGYLIRKLLNTGRAAPELLWMALALCSFFGALAGFLEIRRRERQQRYEVDVILVYHQRQIQAKGLIDTGNRLRTPGGKPVAVADQVLLKELTGMEEIGRDATEESAPGQLLIPYRSVGNSGGLLPALKLTSLTIQKEEGTVVIPSPWVAAAPEGLCSREARRVILPPDW